MFEKHRLRAEAMRQIIVESARRKQRFEHDGGGKRVGPLTRRGGAVDGPLQYILALDKKLQELPEE